MKAVAIASGGMDSTTLLYRLKDDGYDTLVISYDYGQRHKKELEFVKVTCEKLGFQHRIVDLTNITDLIASSSLTGEADVPDGHYTDLTMRATVVPNRNAIMLSIAAGAAMNIGARFVATAVHGGDHFIYPDCRPPFIDAISEAMRTGAGELFVEGGFMGVYAPYVNRDKTAIAEDGDKLGVPWLDTWSCYKGGDIHCGRCGTCVERREAFMLAEVDDPTPYADRAFAWEAIAKHKAETNS